MIDTQSQSKQNPPNTQDGCKDWLACLADSGYRLTAPRRAIVEIMAASQKALEPLQIYDLGRRDYPGLGLVTVYRTLEKLEQLGLVDRVHQPDGCHTYLRAAQGHQHLLLCQECGLAVYFAGDDLGGLFERVGREKGYLVRDHWLQLTGICPDCQKSPG